MSIVLIAAALQIPAIQTKATSYLTDFITKNTGFATSISRVNIRWWDAISLDDVLVYDHKDSLMVNLKEVYIDFSVKGLLDRDNPSLDQIKLINGNVRLLSHIEGEGMNISVFFDRINSLIPRSDKPSSQPKFSIGNIFLEETSLDIINYVGIPVTSGFDYNKLRFRDLLADADEFFSYAGEIGFKTKFLRGIEVTSGIVIQQLQTNFTFAPTFMEFDELYLRSNDTQIKNYLKFSYESIAALSNFNHEVEILASLDESTLDFQDLRYFSDQIPGFEDKITLSGDIFGTVDKLNSNQLLIRFGQRSALFGKFKISGLPYVDETFFEMSLLNSVLNSNDLSPYISKEAQREINKFRDIRFDTDFSGFLTNFTANGNFRTGIGQMIGRVNYKKTNNQNSYNGRVELRDLDLGILLEDKENFQKVSLTGQIRGTGLTLETALVQVDANIRKLGINQYNYTNITSNATFGKDLFSGKLKVNDPNLKAAFDGVLDLRDGKDSVRLNASIDSAYLQDLKILDRDLFVSGKVDIDTKGISLDNIEGIARFSEIGLSYEGRNLSIDNFFFQSLFTDDSRLISLNSDLLVAGISGNFEVQRLINDVTLLSKQYLAILTNSPVPQSKQKAEGFDPYNIDINLNFIDFNPILNIIEPKATISKNTLVEGAFYQTPDNTIFNFFSSIDSIYYNGSFLFDTNIDFNTSKLSNAEDVLASFYIFSKEQVLRNGLLFNNLVLEAIWDQNSIDFTYKQDQFSNDSYINLNSEIRLYPDHTSIIMDPSELKVLDKIWRFAPDNQIYVANKEVLFEGIKLINDNQYLAVNGNISPDPEQILSLEINELNLDFFNTLSLKSYEGRANGIFAISNLYQEPEINGNLDIEDLYINNFLIGDIEAATYLADNRINLELTNTREGKKVIAVNGYLSGESDEISLKARLREANISIMEPFLDEYISQMGGMVNGDLDISGTISTPLVTGTGNVNGGSLKINYLNTFYTLDGNLLFGANDISFREITLKDVNGNLSRMRGGITHDGFRDFLLDITANMDNFQVLNTSSRDNDLFYGTAYASGRLDIFGAANNLDINAKATSQANTRIFIPMGSSNVQAQEDFIRIINIRDTTQLIDFQESVEKLTINNVRMNFDLDVTPDAYVEIQIDPRTGENIQGRGRGVLSLNIDTQGNFSMSGNYEITEAKYNFSLYNIIRREFNVQPGGRITWFGDPYEGIMDLRATYQESVSLQNLQTGTTQGSELEDPQMRRRWPLKVIMDLKGNILSPQIDFDFDFSEYPEGNIQTYISAFRNRIANDEQEKNRQVFSVIMMRSFSPEGQFSGVSNIASSNLSQLLSSQLNSFISQVDSNLEVDIDLASLDQSALETFQLRVAYTFLDGRLRVSRDGGFTDLQGNADINSIAGDWQAEYLITQDGRYRLRIYNRNNFNTFTSLSLSRNVATYGISVSQNLAFNTFKELIDRITKRNREKLRINDTDDFLRYQFENQENWKQIPLDNYPQREPSIEGIIAP
ncbi:translocation/assembly module TamB domain-containing protein [Belliella kenyensis]|uniref:Translocation/assembly module TamB domain-containing protein n=1 Tax=Belliella kenyensis TaxID=1472724 RepID=A0ABV8ERM3_9BACT|nr:translocation/assembly module TamB domain-containing protein [Belliella kenyensis]MCH7403414.1 translocation/assembly module TamB [Belliella kenyensis]MDN3601626.1 translocation/assembly module TamB domain-containing protein [Belliella kenyensis]